MSEFVMLTEVGTLFDAQLVVGALKGADIPVVTDPEGPVDEFTMSRHLLGQGIRILVPEDRLEAAQALLTELRENPPEVTEEEWKSAGAAPPNEDSERTSERAEERGGGKTMAVWLLAVAVGILGYLYIGSLQEMAALNRADPVFNVEWANSSWNYRWKDNGKLASRHIDKFEDGNYEEVRYFRRDGQLQEVLYDGDESGRFEAGDLYTIDGNWVFRWFDHDEDGIHERVDYTPVGGTFERWHDKDQDGRFELIEFLSTEDDTVQYRLRRAPDGTYLREDG